MSRQCFADADLLRTLRDRDEHNIHDADTADKEGDRCNTAKEDGEWSVWSIHGLDEILRI